MEQMVVKTEQVTPQWRVWIDNQQRIVSFHEMAGCDVMEFYSRDLFWKCVEQYTGQQYRYQ